MKLFASLVFIVLCNVLIAQAQDSSSIKLGISINSFGSNIATIISKTNNHESTYFQDVYRDASFKYSLGLNYRGAQKTKINRISCGFMVSKLLQKQYGSFYEINISAGHEWFFKKMKYLYYGGELYAGRCRYNYTGSAGFQQQIFTDGGLILFSGLKINLNKKLELRTELNLVNRFWRREMQSAYYTTIKQRFAIECLKPFSIELFYKF